MNPEPGSHEPSPEFRAHLEWQIASALRREARFAEPASPGRSPWLRLAAMLIVAFALGSIVTIASSEVQDSKERDRLAASVAAEIELLQVRLQLANSELQNARSRYEVGAAGRQTVLDAERDVRARQAVLERARLDLEEIRKTSQPPKNDLDAPRVGSRDFVRDRLALELEAAQARLAADQGVLSELKARFELGTATNAARIQAEVELAQAQARVEQLRGRLELRQRALNGKIKGEDVARAARRMELTVSVERAQRELELTKARFEEVRAMVEIGTATALDAKRLEVELLEKEIELQMLRRSLESLGSKKRE